MLIIAEIYYHKNITVISTCIYIIKKSVISYNYCEKGLLFWLHVLSTVNHLYQHDLYFAKALSLNYFAGLWIRNICLYVTEPKLDSRNLSKIKYHEKYQIYIIYILLLKVNIIWTDTGLYNGVEITKLLVQPYSTNVKVTKNLLSLPDLWRNPCTLW